MQRPESGERFISLIESAQAMAASMGFACRTRLCRGDRASPCGCWWAVAAALVVTIETVGVGSSPIVGPRLAGKGKRGMKRRHVV